MIPRTSSDAFPHNTQKANPEKDEKIQEMMGFLEEDDGDADCLFKVADQLNRKKSNTVEYAKRGRPLAMKLHQIGEYETIEEQETH